MLRYTSTISATNKRGTTRTALTCSDCATHIAINAALAYRLEEESATPRQYPQPSKWVSITCVSSEKTLVPCRISLSRICSPHKDSPASGKEQRLFNTPLFPLRMEQGQLPITGRPIPL